jgi:hypothetical protein
MATLNGMDYYAWVQELKKVAVKRFGFTEHGVKHTDWDAFKDYFIDGYSPKDALTEDSSCA